MKMRLGLLPILCITLAPTSVTVALVLPPGEAMGSAGAVASAETAVSAEAAASTDAPRLQRAWEVPAAVEGGGSSSASSAAGAGGTLESVASRAGETGRKVAMSLIGLAFAVAGVILAFRRDFKEAVGVLAVGLVAVLLVTPAGLGLLRDTVTSLLGAR